MGGYLPFSARASFSVTASRMNAAVLFGPATASMRAICSALKRTVSGRTPSGGLPMRAGLSATALCVDAIKFPQPLIDSIRNRIYL